MVIPPGMASFLRRNPLRNGYFAGNDQLLEYESARGMVIPPGMTSFLRRNPLVE
jgi:hypothetical protein